MSSIELKIEKLNWSADRSRFEEFLTTSDAWMSPPLSQRTDLAVFAEKIARNGVAAFATHAGSVAGLIAFYCNDWENHRAYLTYITVDPKFQGRGIATRLVEYAKTHCSRAGMKSMLLEVNEDNRAARHLYSKSGFRECKAPPEVANRPGARFMICSLMSGPVG